MSTKRRPPAPPAGDDTVLPIASAEDILNHEAAWVPPSDDSDPLFTAPPPTSAVSVPETTVSRFQTQFIDTSRAPFNVPNGPSIRVPYGYEVWRDGVFQRDFTAPLDEPPPPPTVLEDASSREGHLSRLKRVTYRPLFLRARGARIEDKTRLVCLVFMVNRAWQHRWVDTTQLADRTKILTLVGYGVNVHSEVAGDVIRFLAALDGENVELPEYPILRRSGAVDVDGICGWLIGTTWIGQEPLPEPDTRDNVLRDALVEHGDYSEWKGMTTRLMREHWVVRFLLGASFTSPLLETLDVRTFILHHWEKSGGGKTAIARLGQSVWGHPTQFAKSMNRTEKSPVAVFRDVTSLPMLFDELELDQIEGHHKLIYALTQEEDRERLTVEGDTQRKVIPGWRCLIRMTGEAPLVSRGKADLGGQRARVLELCHPGVPIQQAQAIHTWFSDARSYGHAGREYLQQLWPYVYGERRVGRLALRERFESFLAVARAQAPFLLFATLRQVAAVILGEYLMLQWVYGVDRDTAEATVLVDLERVLAILDAQRDQVEDLAQRIAQFLLAHRVSTPQLYADIETEEGLKRARIGASGANEIVALETFEPTLMKRALWYIPEAVDNLLTRSRYKGQSVDAIWHALRRAGVLHTPDKTHVRQVRSRKGVLARTKVVIVIVDALEALAGVASSCDETGLDEETRRQIAALGPDLI